MRGPGVNFTWMDEASAFGQIIGTVRPDILRAEHAGVITLVTRSLTDFPSALIRSGRGYGKVTMRKAIRELHERNPLQSTLTVRSHPVDKEKIRWRCRRPSAPAGSRGSFQDMLERMLTAIQDDSRLARMQDSYELIHGAQRGETQSAPSVVDNVNVVTDRVPPHIAALPESEQGPALVEAIFERKRRAAK